MPVCAAVCDFFTDGAAVCTNMPEAATLDTTARNYIYIYTSIQQKEREWNKTLLLMRKKLNQ